MELKSHLLNSAMVAMGILVLVAPRLVMGWHELGWSKLAGEQPAGRFAQAIFMPPYYMFPRAMAVIFIGFGIWPYVA